MFRLELDYDNMTREDVEQDAKRLSQEFPALGGAYRVEPSKSGQTHWHVIFQRSQFPTFQEAYDVAIQSRADPDWLDLCKQYECFGLETEASRRRNEVSLQKHKILNKPSRTISSPIILDLVPATALDARRIVKISEAIDPARDATWQYKSFIDVWSSLKQHVQIGCIDDAQATRRMKWLSDQALNFTAIVQNNPSVEKKEASA